MPLGNGSSVMSSQTGATSAMKNISVPAVYEYFLDHWRTFHRDLDAEDSMRRYKSAAPTELGTTTIRYSTTGRGATPLSVTNHRWRTNNRSHWRDSVSTKRGEIRYSPVHLLLDEGAEDVADRDVPFLNPLCVV